ncbi:glycosyltransferase family 17 protein [Amanita thiersii Skay4041]|uniref:Glycosyltransferase family 17 protein n=1 Tax=Amanita thiersii Skay4041 TaxID=703135 RepID=A0A2A9NT44_9AGAR|nr:glycosyltransferase family 17 protein [Amanita thiersii Skay4041]
MAVVSFRRPRTVIIFLPVFLLVISALHFVFQYHYEIKNAVSYATRPLWDSDTAPKEVVPHYYAEGLPMDEHTCSLHRWPLRQTNGVRVKVLDAVLMSSELDLLEIRMNELDSVVDHFFIVESNATFTGLPKETYFANNKARFEKFAHKIIYKFIDGYPLRPRQSAWDVEAATRDEMTKLLRSHINSPSNAQTQFLVLMSDVDEIPSRHTLDLLKACDFGSKIHLQLRNFVYSFEWYLGPSSWRASVQLWSGASYYRHSKSTETILADSGWHCSYCFRTISEYIVKMKGFSHADRIGGRINLLDPARIQETICRGKDIFGMLPEAYNYRDLIAQMNLDPLSSAVNLPRYIIQNAEKYRFLLPGGCTRERP